MLHLRAAHRTGLRRAASTGAHPREAVERRLPDAAEMDPFAQDQGAPEPVEVPGHRLLESVPDHAMFLLDRRGRATSWNPGVGQILGWDRSDWLGQPAQVIYSPEDIAAGVPAAELRRALESGRAEHRRWMRRRDGQPFFAVGAITAVFDEGGQPTGFLAMLRDATSSTQAEDERESLLRSERRARAEVERQAAALTAAIEAIPDGVYIGTESGITRCNGPALDMLGASSVQDLQERIDELGRRFRVRRERDGDLVPPHELPFARALQGEATVLETWATKPSGEDVFIRGTAAPIVVDGRILGAVAVNSDLTARLQLEQHERALSRVSFALRERDEQLRALTAGVRDYAIFTVDLQGKISSWHKGAELMKGYTAEEAIGMPFACLFTPEEREAGQPRHEMEQAARTGEYKGEGLRLRKNGETFYAAVVLTALRGPHGELLGYLKLTQNITERKRAEREREELLRDAQAARRDAERASHSKGEFLATISHELRTPLGAILGWAHVLERDQVDAEGRRQGLAAITRNARVQVQLIEDLLDMNRIESGQLRLDVRPVELSAVIAGAVDAVLPAATTKGISVRTVLDPSAGVVMGDPDRLQQIVWNLMSNAVKFTPSGGKVTVSLLRAGDAVEISVADTGQGIQPEFLARAFDRFQQQDASTTRRHGGLGIGLAIVRQLAQLHGGSVRAESGGADQGSTFTVSLPSLAPPTTWRVRAGAQPAPSGAQDGGHGPQRLDGIAVLLIDDEPNGRAIATYVLQEAGAQVVAASSAQEGFDLFRKHRPQVILSDIGMPVHDGYDFLRWVRELPPAEGGRTPAMAFTAYARPEDREHALEAGYQSHLVKPVEPDALVAAVARLTASTAGARAGRQAPGA